MSTTFTTTSITRRVGIATLALGAVATVTVGLTSTAGAESVPAADPALVLGHEGAGDITLGDNAADVAAAGAEVAGEPGDTCRRFALPGQGGEPEQLSGYLTDDLGVVAIFAGPDVPTTEGIRLGATRTELEQAYPQLEDGANVSTSALSAHTYYSFVVPAEGVSEIALVDDRQPCFG